MRETVQGEGVETLRATISMPRSDAQFTEKQPLGFTRVKCAFEDIQKLLSTGGAFGRTGERTGCWCSHENYSLLSLRDAIAEMAVVQNSYSAEYRSGGRRGGQHVYQVRHQPVSRHGVFVDPERYFGCRSMGGLSKGEIHPSTPKYSPRHTKVRSVRLLEQY